MNTHTPGPWRVGRLTVNTGTGAHEGDLQIVTDMPNPPLNDRVVLTVREDWTRHLTRHPQGQANLRLITAAPELLAGCKAALSAFERNDAVYLFADASDDYPAFDLADYALRELAYPPPSLTVSYDRVFGDILGLRETFGFSDDHGLRQVRLGANVDNFAKHRRWQDLIGERAPNVKLTEPKVVEIRERYAAGGISMAKLATEYGVTQATVNGIVWGSLWIYAPGPVKCRQLLRARCTTQTAHKNIYGERTHTEDHPRPEMLTAAETAVIDACESTREDDRYVSMAERRAWRGTMPIEYEWGVFNPRRPSQPQ